MKKCKWKLPAAFIPGAIILSILYCIPVYGASFDIKPVRLEFSSNNQLEKLTVKNLSDSDFSIQIRAYEWSQNEEGEDVYSETRDIIIFPKITTIESGKEGYIRLGTKVSAGMTEKTYRVYIEEMPSGSSGNQGANIRLYTRVGIPIFIQPFEPENLAEIKDISMESGNVDVRVRNAGNRHFIVTGVHVLGFDEAGGETFNRDISGWYLLSGTEKVYSTRIPQEVCSLIHNLSVEVRTKDTALTKQMTIEGDLCGERNETAENR